MLSGAVRPVSTTGVGTESGDWTGAYPRAVESSTGVLVGVTLAASMSTVLALPLTPNGAAGVVVALVPVALALSLQLLPFPARISGGIGTVAAVLAGALLGGLLEGPTLPAGAVSPRHWGQPVDRMAQTIGKVEKGRREGNVIGAAGFPR